MLNDIRAKIIALCFIEANYNLNFRCDMLISFFFYFFHLNLLTYTQLIRFKFVNYIVKRIRIVPWPVNLEVGKVKWHSLRLVLCFAVLCHCNMHVRVYKILRFKIKYTL